MYYYVNLTLWNALTVSNSSNFFDIVKTKITSIFTDPTMWAKLFLIIIEIILILIAAKVVNKVAKRMITHLMIEREKHPLKFDTRRTKTIGKLINNILTYTINFISILLILDQIGFNLAPLLAGAGVLGLAIGFGAQSLVKDVITGFFIIFEDQFAVGDVIKTGNYTGTVEEIGLRITKIKSWTGELHIIPNGKIGEITNFSLYPSFAVVDFSISYEADIDFATKVLKETVAEIAQTNGDIINQPDVLGVQNLGSSEVILRVTAECKPYTHFSIARKMKEMVKKAFDQNGIEIPYPRLVTYQREERSE